MLTPEIKQWLFEVLQNNGYVYCDITQSDILRVLVNFPSLRPKSKVYTHISGISELMLCISGSIPTTIKSKEYKIPIELWIPKDYPTKPPLIFVTPTQKMVLQPGKNVDSDGMCRTELLEEWKSSHVRNDIVSIVQNLSLIFAREPPVFSRNRQSINVQHYSDTNKAYSSEQSSLKAALPVASNPGYLDSQPNLIDRDSKSLQSSNNKREKNRGLLELAQSINEVFVKDVQPALKECHERLRVISNVILVISDLLETDQKELVSINDLIKINNTTISDSIRKSKDIMNRAISRGFLDPDKTITSVDVLSTEFCQLVSEDKAMGDTLDAIEKARNDDHMSPHIYIKFARAIGRSQFINRAKMLSIQKEMGL